jgi:hypothetical protein
VKPEKTANSKKNLGRLKHSFIFYTEINLTTDSVEGENKEYFFDSSKPFSSSKTKLEINQGIKPHCQKLGTSA